MKKDRKGDSASGEVTLHNAQCLQGFYCIGTLKGPPSPPTLQEGRVIWVVTVLL